MKLSASLIVKNLTKRFFLKYNKSLSKQPLLERPRFLIDGNVMQSGKIYIVENTTSYFQDDDIPEDSLVLSVGYEWRSDSNLPDRLCILEDQTTVNVVFNEVQTIFDNYEIWLEALTKSRLNEDTIQKMLDLSYPILGNPLVVIGMDFSIIASVAARNSQFDKSVFGTSADTFAYVTALKQDPLYTSAKDKNGYFYFPPDDTGSASLCVNIKKYGVTTYRLLMVDEHKPLDESDGFLLETLSSLIEHALSHNIIHSSSKDRSLHSVFLNLMNDRTADYVKVSQQLDSLGWYSMHRYVCIVLQITSLDQKNLTVNSICNYVENVISCSCAMLYKDYVVIFVNLSKATMTINEISEKIIYFIRDSFLKAGYSRVMLGHLNLRRQYEQAAITLTMGNQQRPSMWTHRFNDIALTYIMEQATRKLPGYMISHEKLLQLKYMDEDNGSEYLHTLRLYLNNHLNAVQTAKDLFIHRSTFLYRLEKIKSILGSDLQDGDEILYLMLSFRLIDMETNR